MPFEGKEKNIHFTWRRKFVIMQNSAHGKLDRFVRSFAALNQEQ